MTAGDRADLVAAIGVERDDAQFRRGAGRHQRLVMVANHELAAAEPRRQADDQGADHAIVLLGVLVRREELHARVDQQVVQPRFEIACQGQAEIAANAREDLVQDRLPTLLDRDPVARDLPGVANGRVEQRLVLQAVAGGLGDLAQLLRRGSQNRQGDAAGALDADVEIGGGQRETRCERALRLDAGEQPGDLVELGGEGGDGVGAGHGGAGEARAAGLSTGRFMPFKQRIAIMSTGNGCSDGGAGQLSHLNSAERKNPWFINRLQSHDNARNGHRPTTRSM
ncbi:MAG: hypothetical protein QM674_06825 [Burkholderiaceae bacterium]